MTQDEHCLTRGVAGQLASNNMSEQNTLVLQDSETKLYLGKRRMVKTRRSAITLDFDVMKSPFVGEKLSFTERLNSEQVRHVLASKAKDTDFGKLVYQL